MALAAGCHAPAEPAGPTVARVTAESHEQYEQLFEAAAHSLRTQYFRLDRQDHAEGVITTHPETTTNWFELWRPQPSPAYYWWEANLATIQRTATVTLKQGATAGEYDINVEVQRQRYNLPERQIDNSAAAMRLFSSAAPTEEGRMEKAAAHSDWILLGRDAFLEQKVLQAILASYGQNVCLATAPAEFGQP
jgi:hypothetical protein